jgi:tyrosine-protein phosphatase OCA6
MLVWNNSSKTTSNEESSSNKIVLPPLIPPFRFNIVEGNNRNEALYRSAFPTERNYRYLKRLKLKTIISLVPRDMLTTTRLQEFCSNEKIVHIHFPMSSTQKPLDASQDDSNAPAPTHQICAQILTLCIDRERLPLLVHCTNGAHVVGLIIALLRKLQHHTPDSYIEEFVRFTKNHTIDDDERLFIARYFTAVTLPGSLPYWLWGGERPTRHPTLPLFAAAVSVGLATPSDDLDAERDFSPPPPIPVPQATTGRDHLHIDRGEPQGGHHHHHHVLQRAHSADSTAEYLSSIVNLPTTAQDEGLQMDSTVNESLRGMNIEEPSSVMRRRITQ